MIMFSLTLKNLVAHRMRMLSTAFAVVLGVAFMAGTLVFADTLTATIDDIVGHANANVDAVVRSPEAISLNYGQTGRLVDAELLDLVAALPDVAEADLQIRGYAQLVGPDGQPVVDQATATSFGYNWSTSDELNPFQLVAGSEPAGPDEIVIDHAAADASGYSIGDTAVVLTRHEPHTFRIVGVADYGDRTSQGGGGAVLFERDTAEQYLAEPGRANAIVAIAAEGVTQEELVDTITGAIDTTTSDVEVITGQALIDEDLGVVSTAIGPFRTFLLVFAAIAMFVSAFIINNTFSITVAQRSKEMAMLSALGASRRQVTTTVLIEAAVSGAIAAAVGIGAGIGVAQLLRGLIQILGFELPAGPVIITSGSMATAFGLGVFVTVFSALMPARAAGRIPPIAALRGLTIEAVGSIRRRIVIGAVVTAAGVGALLAGLLSRTVGVVGLGAVASFAGVAVLGPAVVRPAARAIGAPFAVTGVSGELAVQNTIRNPKRTARTASALMIGVALVAFMAVVGASTMASFAVSIDENFHGTHVIDSGGLDVSAGFTPELADKLRTTHGIDAVTEFRIARVRLNDASDVTDLEAYDAASVGVLIDLGDVDGDLGALRSDGIAIDRDYAGAHHLAVGSVIPVVFASGEFDVTVRVLFDGSEWLGSQFVDTTAFDRFVPQGLDYRVYVSGDDATVQRVASEYSGTRVLDRAEFVDAVGATIEQFLAVIYALLALAVLIALLGVANTLALAIFERTREIGLLRAIGTTQGQIRTMVRDEAMIVALLGTTVGIGIGTFFGWAVLRTLEDQGFNTLIVPGTRLAVIAMIGGAAGAVTATLPARRAARLQVLDALATA
jgi:putative ABC transport system permease protein